MLRAVLMAVPFKTFARVALGTNGSEGRPDSGGRRDVVEPSQSASLSLHPLRWCCGIAGVDSFLTITEGQSAEITLELVSISVTNGGSGSSSLGTSYCGPGVANSTGAPSTTTASGSAAVLANDVVLTTVGLPTNSFGFYVTSKVQGNVPSPGGSQGVLCLGGAIGRFIGPGQIQFSGTTGEFSLTLDLTQLPSPTGPVAAMAGDTWNFQAWHRDSVGGAATSNFSDGLAVTLL